MRDYGDLYVGLLAVAMFAVLWITRYEVIPANNAAHLRLDRWTGEVHYCHAQGCQLLPTP